MNGMKKQKTANGVDKPKSWRRREVDLVHGFPFVSKVFFFREIYE